MMGEQLVHATAGLVLMAAMFAVFDWMMPWYFRMRDGAYGGPLMFKRDRQEFYAAYDQRRSVRLLLGLTMAIVYGAVTFFAIDEIAPVLTFVLEIVGYCLLIGYYMRCAETNRAPWQ